MKFITELRSGADVVQPSAYEQALIRQPFRNDSPDPVSIYQAADDPVVLEPGQEALFEPREGGGWTPNVRSSEPGSSSVFRNPPNRSRNAFAFSTLAKQNTTIVGFPVGQFLPIPASQRAHL